MASADISDTHRRYTRLKTRQIATLTLCDGQTLDCDIRDFSEKGLNLLALDRAAADRLAGSDTDQDQTITLTLPMGDQTQSFRLEGKLAYGSSSGIGFQTDAMPPEVYQALVRARASLLTTDLAPAGLLHEESLSIQQDCVNLFRLFMEQAWGRFLGAVERTLQDRDTASLPLSDHSRYLNGIADLLRRSQEISLRHFSVLVQKMHRLGETERSEVKTIGEMELSILDEDSFEDWLSIAAVFNRLDTDLRSVMFQFAQRFGRLSPVPIDKHNDPFGPETVCLAFQESIRELDLTNTMRKMLYRQFGTALAAGYSGLYTQFNQLLGPLKPMTPAINRHAGPPLATQVHAGKLEAGQVETQGEIGRQVSRLAEIAEKLFTLYPPSRPAPAVDMPAQAYTGAAADRPVAVGGSTESGIGLSNALNLLEQTLYLVSQHTPAAGMAAQEAAAMSPTQAARQMDALLTTLPGATATPGPASLSEQLRDALGHSDLTGQLSPPHRERLGAMTHLFSKAMTEHAAQSDIVILLRKLERPLYESLLQGEDILHDSHPLRRLFNLVDRFAVVADDQGRFLDPVLQELVASVIDHALAQAQSDPRSYSQACDSLEKLLKQPLRFRKQRVAAYQETCEGQESIRKARKRTAEALNSCLANRRLPRLILTLLEQGWQQYLVLLEARGDEARWARGLSILEALVARASADAPPASLADSDRQGVLDEIGAGLRTVSIDSPQREEFLRQLAAFLLSPSPDAQTDTVRVPMDWFTASVAGGQEHGQPGNGLTAGLRLGEWWDFMTEGRAVPLQLIWMSQPPGTCAFVNRSAMRKVDLTLAQFTAQIRDGGITAGESRDIPLLERSEYGIVDTLYRRLSHQASHDPVTGLLNRRGLEQAVVQHLDAPTGDTRRHMCALLEFDPFRIILDNCGAEAGEALSRDLSALIQRAVGPRDLVASLGDGTFALFMPDLDVEAGRRLAASLLDAMRGYHFRHEQESYGIDVNLGLAKYVPGVIDVMEALRRATTACTAAKVQGRNAVEIYEDSGTRMQAQESMMDWAGRIDDMLAGDAFFLRCQRIAPLRSDPSLSPYYEILLGIRDDSGNPFPPQAFIQAAEHWKRAQDVDLWVIDRTFRWIRAHADAFRSMGGFSVNLSALSLADPGVLDTLHRELSSGDIPAEKIMFEITETATLNSYGTAQDFIRQIRRYGCKFCIDDFGSGNASYNYLRNLKTDTLKIDGMFVKDMVDNPDLHAMVKSMNDIGHSLGMKTVAEFVATPAILAMLGELGVDYGQGYTLHEPVELDQLIGSA